MQIASPNSQRLPQMEVSWAGLTTALTILTLWAATLVLSFVLDLSSLPQGTWVLLVLLRTFLQTGIFITAHDAIHGVVSPGNPWLNDRIGSTATLLYALLPYRQLRRNHHQHHRHPATAADPDFTPGNSRNPLTWYWHFMHTYLGGSQRWVLLFGMAAIFGFLALVAKVAIANLLLFWVLPILLSSMQLFYFGIFLPHREPKGGYGDRHRASSHHCSPCWSFLACYHFGYHWEHHEYPHVPWYSLPDVVMREKG